MLTLELGGSGPLRVLAVGSHADDIEIGCGGTLLRLAGLRELHVHWVVLSASEGRAAEARASAEAFLAGAAGSQVAVEGFRDAFFRYGGEVKEYFEALKSEVSPDLILTHHGSDLHQDHRLVAELTWNTFRDHLILEYEIPKYDGDLGSPNVFVHLDEETARRKAALLLESFPSQREKAWFTEDHFLALMRLRGMEAAAPSGYAEGFYGRKLVF
ncbi:MAG TPA: PIG-L deacetylase family protein [Gaiellaceae bacterium]|nr:PIG-L deacetylase family protein [Gaiellaceae bacterium]